MSRNGNINGDAEGVEVKALTETRNLALSIVETVAGTVAEALRHPGGQELAGTFALILWSDY